MWRENSNGNLHITLRGTANRRISLQLSLSQKVWIHLCLHGDPKSSLYLSFVQYYKNVYGSEVLHRPNIKITIIAKHKCLQRSENNANLYSEHFYGCRFESLGQELEINIARHNHESRVRRTDRKVTRRARKLDTGQGAPWQSPRGI